MTFKLYARLNFITFFNL